MTGRPLQNRVTPWGAIVADPARGLFMGNRGCLHDAAQRLGQTRWRHRAWICCLTAFRNRRRPLMAPARYTELFFLDEATAVAAGHRPCAECRRADYTRFGTAWAAAFDARPDAAGIDRALHESRLAGRVQRRHVAGAGDLPEGAMVWRDAAALLVSRGALWPWTPQGYGAPVALPRGSVEVLTPAVTLAVLRAGYAPVLHPSAGAWGPA